MTDPLTAALSRRDVLRMAGGASLALLLPGLADGANPPPEAKPAFDWKRSLVLIELRGGNDGLNTIIPYKDPAYYRARPAIAVNDAEVLPLDQQFALHPNLLGLHPAWRDKDLAVVHGVGYPNPNRSHFRGIDIWNTGSRHDEMAGDGWCARILGKAEAAPAELLAHSIILGYDKTTAYGGFGPLYGAGLRNIIMDGPERFIREAKALPAGATAAEGNPALSRILQAHADIAASGERMAALVQSAPQPKGDFPKGQLGGFLQTTAKLIIAGAAVPVYKLTLDGFDTHAGQRERHDQLLAELGQGITALRTALMAAQAWDRALVMTYSEFGRRVAENGSQGTDHGTAAAHLLLGGKVKGGHYGTPPSLGALQDGDLVHTVDYRSVYATVAEEWWGWKPRFLSEKGFKPLGIVRA